MARLVPAIRVDFDGTGNQCSPPAPPTRSEAAEIPESTVGCQGQPVAFGADVNRTDGASRGGGIVPATRVSDLQSYGCKVAADLPGDTPCG